MSSGRVYLLASIGDLMVATLAPPPWFLLAIPLGIAILTMMILEKKPE